MTFATIQLPTPPSDDAYVAARVQQVQPGFRVRPIASAKLLRVSMSGFWSRETVADFADAMGRGLAVLATEPNDHLVLFDMSGTPIQSQIVYDSFSGFLNDSENRPRRLAVVTGNTAGRMQARRLLAGRDNARIFDCENDALRWLLGRSS